MGEQNLAARVRAALDAGEGILRLAPTWVPRSFLMPGGRLKLSRDDLYALGTHRGGIDERWFSSTTAAANEGAPPDEGLSYVVQDGDTLHPQGRDRRVRRRDDRRPRSGTPTSAGRSTASSSTTSGRSRTTCTRTRSRRPSWAARASPRATISRRSSTGPATTSPTRSSASSRVRPRTNSSGCLERWNQGDNGILDLSKAYRLKPGTGWLVPPDVLHAPGSLVTYEPQWGSDVFGMYQSMVEGRRVPWELLVKDVPEEYPPRPRLPGRAARLGEERRSRVQEAQLPRADRSIGR